MKVVTLDYEGSNIAFIADLHLNVWKKNNKFFKNHIFETFNELIVQCKKFNCSLIVIAGDIFDTKDIISVEALHITAVLIRRLVNLHDLKIVIMPGNHDMVYRRDSSVTLLSNFEDIKNIHVFSEYGKVYVRDKLLHILPFTHNLEEELRAIDTDPDKTNILVGHFGVSGFKLHENAPDYINTGKGDIDYESNLLNKFDRVFLGHYHGYQTNDHVTYVSAPLQSKHLDNLSKHGFVFYDIYKNIHIFVDNIKTPQFITITLNKENLDKILELKDHYVRLVITKRISKHSLLKLTKKILKNNHDLKIQYKLIEETKFGTIEGWREITYENTEDLLSNFISEMYNKKMLKYDKKELMELVLND